MVLLIVYPHLHSGIVKIGHVLVAMAVHIAEQKKKTVVGRVSGYEPLKKNTINTTPFPLEMSVLGVGTVLLLKRDACVANGHMTKASKN